ncbi:hypothetical protein [Bacteroides helcogenes]|uniref:Uncharacterized protein n=1 Tax=Bacteroides helcogenes (strain ATCC 35417 / DSM 20613 / JCM 6297 / CCUG 15421 / P 36-108) TaxID=693979 RepID=E6SUA2_BACT6|nr:hypothetical protein [Bacteroides helcogenes]ADV44375.1 hypothetical protein Bache_2409 [Bacteroides helcogenes P 36-108]
MKQDAKYLLCCAVIALTSAWCGYWYGSRSRSIVRMPETIRIHDTIYADIPQPEVIIREVPSEIDTAAILTDYFSERHYLDTVIERPYLHVELADVISRNSLLERRVILDYRQPVIHDNALVLGMDISHSWYLLTAGYRHKSWVFRTGYDFYNKSLVVGISKDLWKW